MEIVLLITGVVLGVAGGFLIAKYKFEGNKGITSQEADELGRQINNLSTEKRIAESRIADLLKDIDEWKGKTSMEQDRNVSLNKQLSTKEEAYKNIQEKLEKQKEEIENIQTKFTTEFKLLANEILEDKSKKFTEQNKTNIDEILKPLNEKIKILRNEWWILMIKNQRNDSLCKMR
jgi:DNA recombination protein RmuC